jgi:hypothetical protein
MNRHILLVLPTLAALAIPSGSGSGSPQEFKSILTEAENAYARRDYLDAVDRLREGILVANGVLREALLTAMPLAPTGLVELPNPEPRVDPADPLGSAMALSPSRPIERRYQSRDGRAQFRVLVAPDSPAVQAVGRALARAEGEAQAELVERGPRIGLLTRSQAGFVLRFVVGERHLVEVRGSGVDEEQALARIDAAFLDRVARILGG